MAVSSAASGPFLLAWGMVTEFERRYYQFVNHPAFNRDSGPVSGIGARLHWTC